MQRPSRKFGLTTGLTAGTSTKPASSPEEEKRRTDVIRDKAKLDARTSGKFLDLQSIKNKQRFY